MRYVELEKKISTTGGHRVRDVEQTATTGAQQMHEGVLALANALEGEVEGVEGDGQVQEVHDVLAHIAHRVCDVRRAFESFGLLLLFV